MGLEVLRFYSPRRGGELATASAVAELMAMWAVRIEVGRMQHKRRTLAVDERWLVDGLPPTLPVQRPFLTATFLEPVARDCLLDRMKELGFACLNDERRVFRDWVPLKVGDGFAPLGFFVRRDRRPRDVVEASEQILLLMKFLSVRSDLVFKVIAGRRGWHIMTHHHSAQAAEDFRQNGERQALGLFEFD